MAIVGNEPCVKCQEAGRDSSGNHLLIFEDNGRYCPRADLHLDGQTYYAQGDGDVIAKLLESDVDGNTKYSVNQFKELEKEGKFDNPSIRALALSGMSNKDRWEVSDEYEREQMLEKIKHDFGYFNQLSVRNLVTRGIRGDVARRFDVHVGLDLEGKVSRHYYPVHNPDGSWRGAKCRTLPKQFGYDVLGWTWGKTMMFGQVASYEDLKAKAGRKRKLLIVGGECDAMAAWQMLTDHDKSGKYSYHVWSPVHGEKAMDDIINNKEAINEFDEIVAGFDGDSVGRQYNIKISRLFRGKTKFLVYPQGTKDANECLLKGRSAEFVDAWFNPVERLSESSVKSVDDLYDSALETPEMGQHWFAPKLNAITIGIRDNMLFVIGAGSGVGKTAFTKQVCFDVMERYNEPVGVVYLEEPPIKTLRSYASYYSNGNKRLDLPPNDPDDPESHIPERDYTREEAQECIDKLRDLGLLHIVDTGGDKSIEAVMQSVEDLLALGIKKIVIDNLTAITHPKAGNKVDAIDETMKRIGTFKDENPCTIFLISHLKKVNETSGRTPHNYGGEVWETDFRGSGSIVMWANYVFAIERNCFADTELEKRTTIVRCLKDRDFGMYTGKTVKMFGQKTDGRLVQYDQADFSGVSRIADMGGFDASDADEF